MVERKNDHTILVLVLLLLLAVGGDRFLSHHELRPSVGPVLNPYPHNGICVCVCIGTRLRCPHMHVHMRVL